LLFKCLGAAKLEDLIMKKRDTTIGIGIGLQATVTLVIKAHTNLILHDGD